MKSVNWKERLLQARVLLAEERLLQLRLKRLPRPVLLETELQPMLKRLRCGK